ncbi:MAG TPA: virulence-associated E family protein [Coleofasciculaceae cyanobacterium]|jgi:predicted P-loop ATPase
MYNLTLTAKAGLTFVKDITPANRYQAGLLKDEVEAMEAANSPIQAAREEAQKHLAIAPDKGYAFWEIFKAVYLKNLALNEWDGHLYFYNWTDTPGYTELSKLLNDLENALGTMSRLPFDVLKRKVWDNINTFNPVLEYLRKLPEPTQASTEAFHSLAKTLLGTDDTLAQTQLSKWLIGAVARAVEPGCQMDNALVIRGKQGVGKTQMLRTLFGEHFRTLHSHQNNTENARIMQQAWGCELGEIEATFKAQDISALKAFLTETHDSFRDMHKDLGKARPRHTVFSGNTNKTSFLNDETGSRRFWVIDTGDHEFPLEWLAANRDAIWAVAYHLYQSGQKWWLTSEETELSAIANKAFQTPSIYDEILDKALEELEANIPEGATLALQASDVMLHMLGIQPSQQQGQSRAVATALGNLGYTQKMFNNKVMRGRWYVKEGSSECIPVANGRVSKLSPR